MYQSGGPPYSQPTYSSQTLPPYYSSGQPPVQVQQYQPPNSFQQIQSVPYGAPNYNQPGGFNSQPNYGQPAPYNSFPQQPQPMAQSWAQSILPPPPPSAASNLTQQQLDSFKYWFRCVDKDNSGTISLKELHEALTIGGNKFSLKVVERLVLAFDTDRNGEIGNLFRHEFLLEKK